jgi:hypothetical protein
MKGARVASGSGSIAAMRASAAVAADVAAAETFCDGACGAGTVERIDHEVAGLR